MSKLAQAILESMLQKVVQFNRSVVAVDAPRTPRTPSKPRLQWALSALREEVDEFEQACGQGDVAAAADALLDLVYFALGRLHEMGVVGVVSAFDEVHRANMEKRRGEVSRRPGSLGHDAVKPPGWRAPDLSWLARADLPQALAGWDALSPALKRVSELRRLKGQDYGSSGVTLRDYFPLGDASYVQMIHLKATRLRSLLGVVASGAKPNFEGMLDSVEDLINYATFYAEWLLEQQSKSADAGEADVPRGER